MSTNGVDRRAKVDELVVERGLPAIAADPGEEARAAIDMQVTELLSRALTADAAVHVAHLRNRSLRAAVADVEAAQADLVRAGLLPNPVLSAEVRFGFGSSGTGVELGLVQQLLSLAQRPLRLRLAEAEVEGTVLESAARVFELATDVRRTFFEHEAAMQTLELRNTVAQATEYSADVARRQHAAGNITDLVLANEQALREEAKLALADAELVVLRRREELTALMGLWGQETRWTSNARLPPLPERDVAAEGLESLAVSKRLDLASARRLVDASVFARHWGVVPELGLGAAAEREQESGDWSLGPAIDLPIPLFDRGQAALALARANHERAQERFAAMAVQIRSDVRRAWTELEAARARAFYFERVVLPLRRRIVDETQREYNAMQIGVYQLLQAKREQVESAAGYVDSLRDAWVERVELERAVGTWLPHGRTQPTAPEPRQEPHHQHEHGENG